MTAETWLQRVAGVGAESATFRRTFFYGAAITGPVAGLFADELVENGPEATETAGIAVNYDDPDATAANADLLALLHGRLEDMDGHGSLLALLSVLCGVFSKADSTCRLLWI